MFETLSETQKKIVFEKSGRFVVRACPGSGKTYTVAARLAHKLQSWELPFQGIATISFTNAAWREIERQISEHFRTPSALSYPHFLGTIDSFINNYIFLPFGHLLMGCKTRPVLVGAPHGPWFGRYFAETLFDNLSFDVDGTLYPLSAMRMPRNWTENKHISEAKNRLIEAGYASQSDANYLAMRVLQEHPGLADALVARFPAFMIDEAQDTSEIQMNIINILIEHGLSEIALVGDPDQAIFEWRDARPQLFESKFQEWKTNSIVLNENRRSSQRICDCTCRLSSLETTSTAVNEDVHDQGIIPAVEIFDSSNVSDTVTRFLRRCSEIGIDINPNTVAVLYRSRSFFNLITGIEPIGQRGNIWDDRFPYTRELAKGKYLCDNGDLRQGFRLIERIYACHLLGTQYCSVRDLRTIVQDKGLLEFRKQVFALAEMLPRTGSTVGEWTTEAGRRLTEQGIDIAIGTGQPAEGLTFDHLFGPDNTAALNLDYRLGTIHSVKGETFDAVLVLLKTKGVGRSYRVLLEEGIKTSGSEELRIVYVGITRPRSLLVLAVPDEENKAAWERALLPDNPTE